MMPDMNTSLLLIIDTAHPTARVTLADNASVLAMREWVNTPQVGTDLLLCIQEVFQGVGQKVDHISRIGVHAGPGSYGLVRMGIVTATLLAQASGAELVSISEEGRDEAVEEARKLPPVSIIEPKYSKNVDNSTIIPLPHNLLTGIA